MKAKKILSVFLALCMLLTLVSGLSLPAFAEGETWTDVGSIDALRTAAATDGAYIRLTADITFSDGRAVDVPADTAVVLDLNGHTVSRGLTGTNASSGRYSNCFTVEGKLTIEDSSGDDSGRITGGYCTMHGGGINVTGGELILNGGSICDNVVSPSNGVGGGIYVNNGSFTMNGGLIYDNSAGSGDSSTNGRGGGVGLNRSTFTMNGGRIFSCGVRTGQYNVNRNSSSANGGAVYVGIDSTFTMTGGQLGGLLDLSANQGLDNQAFKAGAAVYVNGYSESSQGTVYPAGAFHMTGGTITGSYCTGTPGGAVYVGDRAEFTMSGDSTIQNGHGDSVYVDKGGIFEMSAGSITKNKNSTVRVNGTFNMTGGSITENAATYGGGVFVDVNGRFTMSDGALITANSASSAGGGVYLKVPTDDDPEYFGGVFTMNGGTISDNKVLYYNNSSSLGNGDGGGVWVGNTCTFNMNGGTITGNRTTLLIYHDNADYNDRDWHVGRGGVFVNGRATFNLSGPSRIYGNLIGDKPESVSPRVESDVVLGGDARINVTGDLTGAYVGLMHSALLNSSYIDGYDSNDDFKESEVMTAGYDTYNPDVHPMAYFFPDVEGFAVVDDNGQAKVLRHVHAFTETLNDAGDTLTVACTGCDLSTELKISAVGGQYTGEPYPATLAMRPEIPMLADESFDAEGIEYLKDGVLLPGAPVEIGNYTARFPVPIGGAQYIVTVDYAITAPVHDHTWAFDTITWTEDASSAVGWKAAAGYHCTYAGCGETASANAAITPASLPAAKCLEDQPVTLTATVDASDSPDGASHSDTKDVTVEKIGHHTWRFVDFTWTGDNAAGYTAVANYVCEVDGCGARDTANADVAPDTLPAAKCVEDQPITLTATVDASDSLDGASHSDTKDVTVEQIGHHTWQFDNITWEGDNDAGYTAVANYFCTVDGCGARDTANAAVAPDTLPAAKCVEDQPVTLTATVDASDSLDGASHSDTKDVTVAKIGHHSWQFVNITWAGDNATGYTAVANYVCAVDGCGAATTANAAVSPETLPDAKCVEDQSVTLTATVLAADSPDGSDRSDTKDVTVAKIGSHDLGGWAQVTPANCTVDGEERRDCSRCDYFETKEIPAPGSHDFDETIEANVTVVTATCTKDGSKTVKCSRCNETEVTVLKAPGHDFDETIEANVTVVEATCTEKGSRTVKCSRCSETKVTELKALGHDFDDSIEANVTVVAPTCTENGSKTVKCSRCDETNVTVQKALGHDWGEWTVVTPETETEKGVEERVCARCGKTETREAGSGNDAPGVTPNCCNVLKGIVDLFKRIFNLFVHMFSSVC